MRKRRNKLGNISTFILPIIFLVSDYIAIVAAEILSYNMRRHVIVPLAPDFHIPQIYIFLFVPVIFLTFLNFAKTHTRNVPYWDMAQRVFTAVFYSIITIVFLMYFAKVSDVVSRLFVGTTWIFSYSFIILGRYTTETVMRRFNLLRIPIVVVGAGKTAELIVNSFVHDSGFSYRILGFIDDQPAAAMGKNNFRILGKFKDAKKIVTRLKVQTVIIAAPGLESASLVDLINQIQPHVKDIAFVPDLLGTPMGGLEVESLMEEGIILLKVRNNLARRYNRWIKRIFDIIVSLFLLPFVLVFGVIVGILIYIDSPGGSPIFSHKRVGRNGKEFYCYKFRTMVCNAQTHLEKYLAAHPEAKAEWDKEFKLKDDPRITRIGAFLRKTSLDELPQLFNVLKGEMSLVGPRPIVKAEIPKYGRFIQDFYLVPPGITGVWQVSGRSDTTYEKRVSMDSWYVRNWSVWIDIVYLVKTVKVVLDRKGAY